MSKETLKNFKVSPVFQNRLSSLVSGLECQKKDLPDLLGIGKDIISRGLNYGIIPKPANLIKLADKFNVAIEYLIGLTDNTDFEKSETVKTFQIRFEELKAERKINNGQICLRLPFERSYFSIWKREGYLPSLEFLFLLADFFQVSLDYILGRTDDK